MPFRASGRLFSVIFTVLIAAPVAAQTSGSQTAPVPERRLALSQDVDFYGSDLSPIFETTLDTCKAQCLADDSCRAFTFNTGRGACFPKSDVGERTAFAGAVSARVIEADAAMLAGVAARQATLDFLLPEDFRAARALALDLADRHPVEDFGPADYTRAALEARQRGDAFAAAGLSGAAAALSDAPDIWTAYAEALLAIESSDWRQRQEQSAAALAAAIGAYLRTDDPAAQAAALLPMAAALERTSRLRETVPALRLASTLSPREDIAALRDRAQAQFGFRMTDHVIESDPATARVCALFSDPLAKTGVDYAPFVQVDDASLSVEAEDYRLCVVGVTHGERYRVTFRQGLPAASGDTTAQDVTLNLYIRDRSPAVRFPGRSYVLPKAGEPAIPVVTVNTPALDLILRRVSDRNLMRAIQSEMFGRPVEPWQQDTFASEISEELWRGTATVETALNRDVTTRLPMADAIADLPAGIYVLQAQVPGEDTYEVQPATQWFVISDLGVATLAGVDGLHVFVRGLGDALPKVGATVTLVSRANAVLGTAQTNAEGYATFPVGLTRGTGGSAPALVTVEQADDIAFLSLTEPAFDLTDRGVEGREPAPPIDLFLTTDRGAYRAGEAIVATALARDGQARAIDGLPLTAILTRPDGVEYSRHFSGSSVAGGHVFTLPTGATVPRGAWRLAIHADVDAPPLATRTVLVEDFLPERIDFDLALPEGRIGAQDKPDLTLSARYLFGAPGAGLTVNGGVALIGANTLEEFPGYSFGRHDTPFTTLYAPFDTGRTDDMGRALVSVRFPETGPLDRPVEARMTVEVTEGSGRPVERRLSRILSPDSAMIGIHPAFDGVAPEGAEAVFDLIAVDPALRRTTMPVRWVLNRVETRYQWYQLYGSWNWEPVTTRSRVSEGALTLTPEGTGTVAVPVEWGQYELRVERTDGQIATTSVGFDAGWYAPADASASPDVLEVSLDRAAYAAGDTARLRVVAREPGKGLITVLSNRLIAMQAVDLPAGESTIDLPVTDDWGAGAYVTATLIRPMDAAAGRMPTRALGLAHAAVDPGARALQTTVEVAAQADPRGPLPVAVRVDGIAAGETAFVTLAAVDVGILNLTGFQSPDPQAHYFGQRKLGVALRDLYGRLIDPSQGQLGQVRSGGDRLSELRLDGEPPTDDLLAYFSGPLAVGPDGYARTTFDLPAFNGTVRLMAVAWSPTGVGQAQADVLVRDPIVLTASVPRFLTPGDGGRMLLEVAHASGAPGRVGLDVTASGVTLGAMPSGVDLALLGRATVPVSLIATDPGPATLTVRMTTPEGKVLARTLHLTVQVQDPEIARQSRFTLAAGQTLTLDANALAGLQPGTARAVLSAGPLALFDAPGLLAALDRYPYGCTEQVASAAMPLLYFSEVAQALGLEASDTARLRVGQAIRQVLTNQSAEGSFGLWGAGSGDLWLDAYVTDFLSRARTLGHDVPDVAFRSAMDNLRNAVNYYGDFDTGGQDLAYALFVLAREGAAAVGDLRYYADVKGEAFGSPLATAQLAAALAAYGDQTRADTLFARAARQLDGAVDDPTLWRADYGTTLRDTAGVLTLAVESGSTAVDRAALAARIAASGGERSTQEALWTLLAAHALIDRPQMRLSLNGTPVQGPLVRLLESQALAGLEIRNDGGAEEALTLTTFGTPTEPEPAGGTGWAISRSYWTMEGEPADPSSVRAGTRLVAVLEVAPLGAREARLMVDDPLPAGFEIDNPNLLRTGQIGALDWLETAEPQHSEFRADRFLAAVDHRGADAFRLAYIVRAVTPGTFHHAAAAVVDMYRPDQRARTDAGRVTVTE